MQLASWVKATLILAVKTFAQTLVGLLGAGQASIIHASWGADLSVAAFAAVACVLHNVNNLGGSATPVAKSEVALVPPVDIPNPRENADAPGIPQVAPVTIPATAPTPTA